MGSDAENGESQVIKKIIFASCIVLPLLTSTVWAEEKRMDYSGYTLWLDCDKRSAVRFGRNEVAIKSVHNLPTAILWKSRA